MTSGARESEDECRVRHEQGATVGGGTTMKKNYERRLSSELWASCDAGYVAGC